MTVDVDEVRAALSTRTVLEHYGWKAKRSGDEFESNACPARSDHSRRAFLVNAASGRWRCFPCATSGDLFDFIAAVERVSMPADFGAVLAKAAEIAGVGPSTLSIEERARKREEWKQRQREAERRERDERRARDEAAVPTATAHWNAIASEHSRGIAYLRARGVGEVALVPNAVRFDPKHDGAPALALYSFTSQIHNVVVRRFPELGEPKTPGLYRCPTAGTLLMSVAHIAPGKDVVLVEGVFDTITARLAWPDAIVLGAHGADNVPKIARQIAPRIRTAHGRLLVVTHQDKCGFEAGVEACEIAVAAGLGIRRGTIVIVKHDEKDLNDAWQRGWRPAA